MVDQPLPGWRAQIRHRYTVVAVVFLCWTVAIVARLLFLQVYSYDDLQARANGQQQRIVPAAAKRGDIYDRNGRLLAYSVDADTIYAVPGEIRDPEKAATKICAALIDCDRSERAAILKRLGRTGAFSYVKRQVTPAEARAVAALGLEGIGFTTESKRFYPNRELASHLVGYAGTDNGGLGGIEAAFDKVVKGKEGKLLVQTDARGRAFSRLERQPTAGGTVELTIDSQLQYIAERELRAGVREHRADAGTAVILDPNTGEILAMANWPTFNPNIYGESPENARRNRAIQDLYEPGSTFKIVTASAAIEEHLFNPADIIDVSAGLIRIGNRVVDDMHRYGPLSFTDVLVKSSNVGAIKIGSRVGAERMIQYVRRFGFGRPTSHDFQGESSGIVWSNLNDSALASVSMGYQIGVTPLQVVAAASAVANGGTLYEPRVIRAITKDGVRTVVKPTAVRTAIKKSTAATLTTIMEQVVERGTATRAKIPGYTIAGKTGTADKLINGRYSNSQQNVSFVGFVPSRNPALAIIVMIDSPRAGGDTGGVVAAPIFQRIAADALRHLGVPLSVNPSPAIIVPRRAAGAPLAPVQPVVVPVRNIGRDITSLPVTSLPDLRGYGAREAVHELVRLGLTPRVRGLGIVVDQEPDPGAPIEPGTTCTLVLDRDPHAALVPGVPQ
ncbi:MAG TPA: penicillin-binding protein [Vicinamibacterales bacterium]|nr:penicillin-binding protein [Vicinamibacterales bacterium]